MEYLWLIFAAALAGIGTGLAGLSAATVMVPILIVMCPSFSGEAGVYQATAIALASDILGSAATTGIYIKHKNIDLKRGWIMLVCIVAMCTLGSAAAWAAGNVVLGGFTLFLTFCIGIKFLIKPDTQRKNTASKGEKLDLKGVIISLFFGLTIGFGAGFVGTGGGMMMLVVFTAFLGMELKSAVGTSTFIMTFTALIASAAHIIINPEIITERWDALLICSVTATAASIISAQFANKVNNRTVGLVTGAVLTVLGAAMIILNYREFFIDSGLIKETGACFGKYLLFILPAAAVLLTVKLVFKPNRDLFRKLLHTAAFMSSIVIMSCTDRWLAASFALVLFAAVVYPILAAAEKIKGFSNLLTEKKQGEIKKSLLLLFLSDAVIVAVMWGAFGLKYAAMAAIFMWGMGDAAAALVGKPFGKHKIRLKYADPNKSWEGTAAMFITSFLSGIGILYLLSAEPWYYCAAVSAAASALGAYTELVTKGGNDTVTVPAVNCGVFLMFELFF
ncbi:MAG: TSUP family transporter [Oscillospiraceae bacterium]|nr:TSUP family transporter [Oscillospiraceae bacterium]